MTASTAVPVGKAIRVGETARRITQSHPAYAGRSTPATRKATGLNYPDKNALDAVARDIRRYDAAVKVAESVLGEGQGSVLATTETIRDLHDRVRVAATRAARSINDMATDFDVLPEINRELRMYRAITDPELLYTREGSVSQMLEVTSVKVIDAARKLYRDSW